MKVAEYRDLIRALLQIINDWQACTSTNEREAWAVRAARVHAELAEAACMRATIRDSEMRALAQQKYCDLVAGPPTHQHSPCSTAKPTTSSSSSYQVQSAGTSRADGYNKSPARAVRLSRAARGAMRRGYV